MTTTDPRSLWVSRSGAGMAAAATTIPSPRADVVVVGAGIVGVTAAVELARRGRRVVLVEAGLAPGRGVTGQSTAKVTTGHGLRLSHVLARHAEATAVEYAMASQRGLTYVRSAATRLAVRTQVVAHDLYASDGDAGEGLTSHAADAVRCGLQVLTPGPDELLPPASSAASAVVRYPDQLLIDPVEYVEAMTGEARRLGAEVLFGVPVVGIDGARPARVRTSLGDLHAHHVLLASHVPFPLRTKAFALGVQRRHYAVAGWTESDVATSLDVGAGWSTRPVHHLGGSDRPAAIVVGAGHATGAGGETAALHRLRVWATERLGMDVTHAWSTQDLFTTDLLPLCGSWGPGLWMATGFGAWGLTLGTAAAVDLASQIADGGASHVGTWRLQRPSLLVQSGDAIKASAMTAVNLAGSLMPRLPIRVSAAGLDPGQGRVVRSGTQAFAVSRDRHGTVHCLSARCTHLGCLVGWNAEAQSWDCPCHGSRFGPGGEVRHGPAVHPLERRDDAITDEASE